MFTRGIGLLVSIHRTDISMTGNLMRSNSQCIIVIKELTKDYYNIRAVDHISFCIRKGEIFGFLGPNGAGKTTTVRMLVGLTRITFGEAFICGYDVVRDYRRVRELIGVVPDTSNMYSDLTCMENLIFSAKMYRIPRNKRRNKAEELLKFFGLWKYRNTKFKYLSKGLKRRLTIAASLVHDPKVLFLDEPTTGLDVMGRRALWKKLLILRDNGITIFLTTHNVHEAFQLSDRVAIINKGKIVAIGSPSELQRKFSVREVLEISFYPNDIGPSDLYNFVDGAIRVNRKNDHLEIILQDEIRVLKGLLEFAKKTNHSITMIRLRGADAEDLFIRIIGEENA